MQIKMDDEMLPAEADDSRHIRAANLPVVHENSATPEVKKLYRKFREDFGRPHVPGIILFFSTHPPLLENMMGLAKTMLFIDGALGRQHKEMISAFVSATNRCAYCADSHGYSFRLQGGLPGALDAVLNCDLESPSINAHVTRIRKKSSKTV
jgi:AhpD family alkylhydroperoxidase